MEPRIVDKLAFTVVGMKCRGTIENNQIPGLWQEFGPRMAEIKGVVSPNVAYGVTLGMDEKSGEFDYVAGMAVTSADDVPDGMVSCEVPEQKYAVFTGTLPTVGQTYQYIYHDWLPQSGYQRTVGPEFELYDENFDPADDSSQMDIYIPIQ